MINKSKKNYAYTMIDATGDEVSDKIIEDIKANKDIIKIRIIK